MAEVEMVEAQAPVETGVLQEPEKSDAIEADATAEGEDVDDSSSTGSASEAEPAAVLTRERRTNAGNRYSKLLAAEAGADADAAEGEFYTAEGWQEQADDEAFSGSEADAPDDISLNSSSSDDEDGDDGGAEDQGEKELRRQERAERAVRTKKRRTMHDVYKPRPVKRARTAVSAAAATADGAGRAGTTVSQPKKKSERVSWIPLEGHGPQRQSSRKLAVENKVRIHQRLEKAEKHRLRTLAIMQAADQRKAAVKAKEMTQEERLAEAMTIEKRNAKSLNRWEENERLKEEERREKLAAMKNRKLEGPYLRYWSGQAVWCADKLRHVGRVASIEEIEEKVNAKEQERFRKQQERERQEREAAILASQSAGVSGAANQGDGEGDGEGTVQSQASARDLSSQPQSDYPSSIMFPPPPQTAGFLEGIHDWATHNDQQQQQQQQQQLTNQADQAAAPQAPANTTMPDNPPNGSTALPLPPPQPPSPPPAQPPPHYTATLATATLVILESFPSLTNPEYTYTAKSRAKDREEKDRNTISRHLLNFEQPAKGTKYATAAPQELCEITSRVARYRDPISGLAYADRHAFKLIRRLMEGRCEWSGLLGAFVGPGGGVRGVPEVFVKAVRHKAV